MKLYEHMAKALLRQHGVPVPAGRPARSPEEAEAAARELGPVAVKAQVLAGGRGKAGGVRLAGTPAEAAAAARAVLGLEIAGRRVETVYVEERLPIDREIYLAVTIDTAARRPLVIASAAGGVDVEAVPEKDLVRLHVDLPWGLQPFAARDLARRLGLGGAPAREFAGIALRLYDAFRALDAELLEINPLAVCGERLVAADAKLSVDDDALFRHPDLPAVEEASEVERRIRALGLAFVPLDGDIAVMANGAGMAMATLDALQRFGGRPMNFLDAGGGAAAEPMARALETLMGLSPRVVFVNIFGGITRCDEVARAILAARETVGIPVPLVVRLQGTNEAEGVRMLSEAGIPAFRSMAEAAARAAALAGAAPPAPGAAGPRGVSP